jgi:hypothetical protein
VLQELSVALLERPDWMVTWYFSLEGAFVPSMAQATTEVSTEELRCLCQSLIQAVVDASVPRARILATDCPGGFFLFLAVNPKTRAVAQRTVSSRSGCSHTHHAGHGKSFARRSPLLC